MNNKIIIKLIFYTKYIYYIIKDKNIILWLKDLFFNFLNPQKTNINLNEWYYIVTPKTEWNLSSLAWF